MKNNKITAEEQVLEILGKLYPREKLVDKNGFNIMSIGQTNAHYIYILPEFEQLG